MQSLQLPACTAGLAGHDLDPSWDCIVVPEQGLAAAAVVTTRDNRLTMHVPGLDLLFEELVAEGHARRLAHVEAGEEGSLLCREVLLAGPLVDQLLTSAVAGKNHRGAILQSGPEAGLEESTLVLAVDLHLLECGLLFRAELPVCCRRLGHGRLRLPGIRFGSTRIRCCGLLDAILRVLLRGSRVRSLRLLPPLLDHARQQVGAALTEGCAGQHVTAVARLALHQRELLTQSDRNAAVQVELAHAAEVEDHAVLFGLYGQLATLPADGDVEAGLQLSGITCELEDFLYRGTRGLVAHFGASISSSEVACFRGPSGNRSNPRWITPVKNTFQQGACSSPTRTLKEVLG